MWRLKVADGGDDPNIYRTNNFVGRQTREFDPDYGTPEERAEVEAARENYWRMQEISSVSKYARTDRNMNI